MPEVKPQTRLFRVAANTVRAFQVFGRTAWVRDRIFAPQV